MRRLQILLAIIAAGITPAAIAQEPAIPNYWDEKERLPKPDLSAVERVRFLTTVNFPPFNFIDSEGRLSGFHIELARAVCEELEIVPRCQIQALPWEELDEAITTGEGEALLAGVAITAESRKRYAFSRPYLRFPARFAVRKASPMTEPMHVAVNGKRVGVLDGSAHEAMLRGYFPEASVVTYSRESWLREDLREGNIDAAFGDGMRLSFWLDGAGSAGCCRFAGGPYIAPEHLGSGMAIAVAPQDAALVDAFDFALRQINDNGKFAELYLKYFPISFY